MLIGLDKIHKFKWKCKRGQTSSLYFPGITSENRNSLLSVVNLIVFLSSLCLSTLTRVTDTDGPHFSLQDTAPRILTRAYNHPAPNQNKTCLSGKGKK